MTKQKRQLLNIRVEEELLADLKEIAWMMGPDTSVSSLVRDFLESARPTLRSMAEASLAARRGDAEAAARHFAAVHQGTLDASRQFDEGMRQPLADLGELAQQQSSVGEPDAKAS